MVKPAVVCGSEMWVVTEMDVKTLDTWEKIILRKIYTSVVEQGIWRVRTDQELRELCKCLEAVADIGMDWTCSKNRSGMDS
jgi:hypothetical protein